MRALTMVVGLLLAASSAALADHASDIASRSSNEVVRAQATTYATQMMNIFEYITRNYVRGDVRKEDLARASLIGLYQAAREPLPASLWADLAPKKEIGQIAYVLTVARERLGDLDAIRDRKAVVASLNTIGSVLDPFSGRPPLDRRSVQRSNTTGVGLKFESQRERDEFSDEEQMMETPRMQEPERLFGPVRVAEVFPGSPAQCAGIRPGDVLTRINDLPIESPDAEPLYRCLSAPQDGQDKLRLTFVRMGSEKPVHCELMPTTSNPETVFGVRRRLDNSWDFMLDAERRIGYLRLGFIDQYSDDEMEHAINELKGAGMRGLIFDLRGCPGGFLEPAKAISGMFIKSGLIAKYTNHREREGPGAAEEFRVNNGSGILDGIATVVLIDEETRGGGEMVAAVLQDHKVARLAGRRTFGKGTVQNSETLQEAGGVKIQLTTGIFTRPNGKQLQRFSDSRDTDDWGVRPDQGMEFPMSPELSMRVKAWMKQFVLRPGDGRDPLPLDDLDYDPLREFAHRELLKQIKSSTSSPVQSAFK